MCNARPCRCSCDLIPVENAFEAVENGPVGAFTFGSVNIDGQSFVQLRVKLPNEGGQYHGLFLYQEGQARPEKYASWKWDGNTVRPTLTPSIRTRLPSHAWEERDTDESPREQDMEESWHGFITKGQAVSC